MVQRQIYFVVWDVYCFQLKKDKREYRKRKNVGMKNRRATINMSKQRHISKEVKTQKTQHGACV